MDGSALVTREPALRAAGKVGAHGLVRGLEQRQELVIVELCRGCPGIDAARPQRFASIDVADAGGDALVEEEFTDGGGAAH
jgi:hypothetical protein